MHINFRTRDLIAVVHAQLPRALQNKYTVNVEADAFLIKATAVFVDAAGRRWEVELETGEIAGVPVSCLLPEMFIAELCAVT